MQNLFTPIIGLKPFANSTTTMPLAEANGNSIQSLCRPCRADMMEGACPLPLVTCLRQFTHGYAPFALAGLIFSVTILDLYTTSRLKA